MARELCFHHVYCDPCDRLSTRAWWRQKEWKKTTTTETQPFNCSNSDLAVSNAAYQALFDTLGYPNASFTSHFDNLCSPGPFIPERIRRLRLICVWGWWRCVQCKSYSDVEQAIQNWTSFVLRSTKSKHQRLLISTLLIKRHSRMRQQYLFSECFYGE